MHTIQVSIFHLAPLCKCIYVYGGLHLHNNNLTTLEMNQHKYILEPYKSPSSRYTCPRCEHKRKFSRYIDTESGKHLANYVGRCDRQDNCGYHYTPKQYFHDHPDQLSNNITSVPPYPTSAPPKPISQMPETQFMQSLSAYNQNNLVTYLYTIFDKTTVLNLIKKYCIGTSKKWPGSTVFWQVNTNSEVRAGKIMQYDAETGHRTKLPFDHITWVHSVLKLKDYNLQQCFFGEHLLTLNPDLPVQVVESEKTSIIASVYFPKFVWIATGGKNGCKWTTWDVCKVLKGRKVVFWPDIKAYDEWHRKAEQLKQYGLQVEISDLLERKATKTERSAGLDIADYLIRFPIELFNLSHKAQPP